MKEEIMTEKKKKSYQKPDTRREDSLMMGANQSQAGRKDAGHHQ